jgi:predicted dithiol-disulfide oxidoreductase (DUF899 family)
MIVRDDVHIAQVSRIVAATEIWGLFGCRALLLQFCVRDGESDLKSQQRSSRSLQRNTTFAVISRAPLSKLGAYKALRGWTLPWYSSFESDFNYDFHVTLDESVAPRGYNYRSAAELDLRFGEDGFKGEQPGLSVFFRLGDDLFHTYSTYARGTESLTDAYSLLDATPYGRQEDFEDSPPGWPQKKTYG